MDIRYIKFLPSIARDKYVLGLSGVSTRMGQSVPCACFEHMQLLETEDTDAATAVNARLKELITGAKFTRKAYLGLSQQDLFVNLSEDLSAIQWRTENTWTTSEKGELDLTSQVKKLKTSGDTAIQFLGLDGETVMLEIKSEDTALRDKWVVVLNELLQSWVDNPASKPRSAVTATGSTNKNEYFKRREEEIKAREKVNAERKAKYAAGGMNFTAQIMADRAS